MYRTSAAFEQAAPPAPAGGSDGHTSLAYRPGLEEYLEGQYRRSHVNADGDLSHLVPPDDDAQQALMQPGTLANTSLGSHPHLLRRSAPAAHASASEGPATPPPAAPQHAARPRLSPPPAEGPPPQGYTATHATPPRLARSDADDSGSTRHATTSVTGAWWDERRGGSGGGGNVPAAAPPQSSARSSNGHGAAGDSGSRLPSANQTAIAHESASQVSAAGTASLAEEKLVAAIAALGGGIGGGGGSGGNNSSSSVRASTADAFSVHELPASEAYASQVSHASAAAALYQQQHQEQHTRDAGTHTSPVQQHHVSFAEETFFHSHFRNNDDSATATPAPAECSAEVSAIAHDALHDDSDLAGTSGFPTPAYQHSAHPDVHTHSSARHDGGDAERAPPGRYTSDALAPAAAPAPAPAAAAPSTSGGYAEEFARQRAAARRARGTKDGLRQADDVGILDVLKGISVGHSSSSSQHAAAPAPTAYDRFVERHAGQGFSAGEVGRRARAQALREADVEWHSVEGGDYAVDRAPPLLAGHGWQRALNTSYAKRSEVRSQLGLLNTSAASASAASYAAAAAQEQRFDEAASAAAPPQLHRSRASSRGSRSGSSAGRRSASLTSLTSLTPRYSVERLHTLSQPFTDHSKTSVSAKTEKRVPGPWRGRPPQPWQ